MMPVRVVGGDVGVAVLVVVVYNVEADSCGDGWNVHVFVLIGKVRDTDWPL